MNNLHLQTFPLYPGTYKSSQYHQLSAPHRQYLDSILSEKEEL